MRSAGTQSAPGIRHDSRCKSRARTRAWSSQFGWTAVACVSFPLKRVPARLRFCDVQDSYPERRPQLGSSLCSACPAARRTLSHRQPGRSMHGHALLKVNVRPSANFATSFHRRCSGISEILYPTFARALGPHREGSRRLQVHSSRWATQSSWLRPSWLRPYQGLLVLF